PNLPDHALAPLPPTIALRKQAEQALAAAARAGSEDEVRAIVAAINAKIAEGNRKGASRPPPDRGPVRPTAGGRPRAGRPRARPARGRLAGRRLPPEHRLEGVVDLAVAAVGLAVGLVAFGVREVLL